MEARFQWEMGHPRAIRPPSIKPEHLRDFAVSPVNDGGQYGGAEGDDIESEDNGWIYQDF